MGSQIDIDQGGTYRETQRVFLGPSVGWIDTPLQWRLDVIAGGTTSVARGTNLILVNFNGAVTLQMPSFKASSAGAQAIPRQFALVPVVIVDTGGFAQANPITILPFGTELFSGQSSIQLGSNYGSIIIRPDLVNGGGTLLQ